MGFWDEINHLIDSSKGSTTNPGFGDAGGDGLDFTGYNPFSNATNPSGPNPRALDEATQNIISQRRNLAYQTIDIEPFHYLSGFSLTIPQTTLFNLVGYEGENDRTLTFNGKIVDFSQWRTLPLSIQGNFLRVEVLPAKVNFEDAGNALTVTGGGVGGELGAYKEDQSYSGTTDISFQFPSKFPHDQSPTTTAMHRAMNPILLFQFDEVNGPIVIGNDGTQFNAPFTQVYITFKIGSPRFRLVVGSNTSIQKDNVQKLLNCNPAFGPGHGLWENPARHCIPFCFSSADQQPINTGGRTVGGAPATDIINLFVNANPGSAFAIANSLPTSGITIGWITNISLAVMGGTAQAQIGGNFFIQNSRHLGTNAKLYCCVPFLIPTPTVTGGTAHFSMNKPYTVPIRFLLKPGDILQAILSNNSTAGEPLVYMFSIEGYIYGRIGANLIAPGNQSFTYTTETLTTNPFPLDSLNEPNSP